MNAEQHQISTRIAASMIRDHQCTTPFLMLDEPLLCRALGRFRQHLPGVQIFYAVKANPAPALIRYFVEQELSFDVASAGEVALLSRFGVDGARMFLSTPVKSIETLGAMFRAKVAACAVDTSDELDRIVAYREAHRLSHTPKIFVRIRIESKHVEVDLNTKFGCSLAEAFEIIRRSAELGLEIVGICFHVGTQSTDPDNYFLGVRSAMLVADESFRRFGRRIPIINIGGGFCDPLTAARAGIDLDEYYAAVGVAARQASEAGFEVYAEPGRCLVSEAGALVTSVVGTNVRNGRPWAYLDDGMYGCFSIKLYEKHPFEFHRVNQFAPHPSAVSGGEWTVAGPTCDSLDVVAENVPFSHPLQSGDVLLTPNLGAYSLSTACGFNGFRQPECYVVRGHLKGKGKVVAEILSSDTGSLKQRKVGAR